MLACISWTNCCLVSPCQRLKSEWALNGIATAWLLQAHAERVQALQQAAELAPELGGAATAAAVHALQRPAAVAAPQQDGGSGIQPSGDDASIGVVKVGWEKGLRLLSLGQYPSGKVAHHCCELVRHLQPPMWCPAFLQVLATRLAAATGRQKGQVLDCAALKGWLSTQLLHMGEGSSTP